MRADFYQASDPETVVGSAHWTGRSAEITTEDGSVRTTLARTFRATPVVVDDRSLRPSGTEGDVVIQPGSLEWFRFAATSRTLPDELRVRLVPEVESKSGWDPASAYRTFRQVITWLESPAAPEAEPTPEGAKPL